MTAQTNDGLIPWPADLAESYRAAGAWDGLSLGHHLRAAGDRFGDRTALIDGETRLTFAELLDRADACASRLRDDVGLHAGDRLVVQLPNVWECVVLLIACLRAGVDPVLALPGHRHHELTHFVRHSSARAIAVQAEVRDFDNAGLAHRVAADQDHEVAVLVARGSGAGSGPREWDLTALSGPPVSGVDHRSRWDADTPAGSDLALFLLSGGTTGVPKLIPRTHQDYAYNARLSARLAGMGPDSVYLVALPVTHNFPLACPGVLGALIGGSATALLPSPEPASSLTTIERERVTHTAVVPAVAIRWMDHHAEHPTHDLSSLQVLQVGGSRLADEAARRVRPVLGATLQQVFGMAEGLINVTRLDDDLDTIISTQGRPISPLDEIRLVDDMGEDVGPGEPGALITQGPYTLRGYYRVPEKNATSFTADGWYRSGDVCRLVDGNLVVEGRDNDLINRGGEKISAEEVENFALTHPGVRLAAAVAMPDAALGERICLYVVADDGVEVTTATMRTVMDEAGIARFKHPERVVVVDELPTTRVGKIDKKHLREDIRERTRR